MEDSVYGEKMQVREFGRGLVGLLCEFRARILGSRLRELRDCTRCRDLFRSVGTRWSDGRYIPV
jgi:hypothetical protein